MKNHNVIIFVAFLAIFSQMLFAESKTYVDEKLGYNVIVEVNMVSKNMTKDEIKEYCDVVFDWSNEIAQGTHRINKLTKELEWALEQGLSEYKLVKGETYLIRMSTFPKNYTNSFTFTLVVLTISEKDKFKIHDVIEAFVGFEEENDTEIIYENGMTKYKNQKLGYCGSANAQHMGSNLTSEQLQYLVEGTYEFSSRHGYCRQLQKLTKEQDWLLQQGMQKYDKKRGETYSILIMPEPKSFPTNFISIMVILTITDVNSDTGDYSYNFYAFESTAVK